MATQTPVRPQRLPAPRLRVMADARPHLTPFRRRVVRLMCAAAAGELGTSFKSALVSLWRSQEEDTQNLVLTLEAEADDEEINRVFREIVNALIGDAKNWSDAQREDCRRWIYFELEQFPS